MVSKCEFKLSGPSRFLEGENMILLLNSDIVILLLKTDAVRDRRPNFVIFVVWSALIVGGWVVLIWSRKSCLGSSLVCSRKSCLVLAEIASYVFLVLFKYGVAGSKINERRNKSMNRDQIY